MATLTIGVSDLDAVKDRMKAAFRGEQQGCRFTFLSEEALLAMLNPNRWAILKALTGLRICRFNDSPGDARCAG
ncbi:MAG: hypothetical protein ACLFNA_10655 [Halochromatium sp.]|uniref:hypothetical protein n=1 Tax=Halochromatium sp. TaxID=2049430 RepID=UPI00397CC4DB